jgi:Cyclic nucleotide-binding domain
VFFCAGKGTDGRALGVYQTSSLIDDSLTILQSNINIIKDTKLSPATIGSLAMFVNEKSYRVGEYIIKEGQTTEAALYLIHNGKVELTSPKSASTETAALTSLCHFGEEMMLIDQIAGSNGPSDPTTAVSPYTARVTEDCQVGILFLEDCRKCFDTVEIGRGSVTVNDSLFQRQVKLAELKKHTILGAGKGCSCLLVNVDCGFFAFHPRGDSIEPIKENYYSKKDSRHMHLPRFEPSTITTKGRLAKFG